jgi:hypothetical protein
MKNPHLANQTSLSRTGKLDMSNRKPFRSDFLKNEARRLAVKGPDGVYRAPNVPVLFHPAVRG